MYTHNVDTRGTQGRKAEGHDLVPGPSGRFLVLLGRSDREPEGWPGRWGRHLSNSFLTVSTLLPVVSQGSVRNTYASPDHIADIKPFYQLLQSGHKKKGVLNEFGLQHFANTTTGIPGYRRIPHSVH